MKLGPSLAVRGDAELNEKFVQLARLFPPMMLKNVNCSAEGDDLIKDCTYDGWFIQEECELYQRAGVVCSLVPEESTS